MGGKIMKGLVHINVWVKVVYVFERMFFARLTVNV